MFATIDEVLVALAAGNCSEHKSSNVELKRSWTQGYGHKLSSLGNKTELPTAWMLVGVEDDGSLAGKTEAWAKAEEQTISNHINQNLDPVQTCYRLSVHEVNGSWVIVIGIRNPGEVVYWGTTAYIAAGTTLREMEPHEALELRLRLPGLTDFSRQERTSEYQWDLVSSFLDQVNTSGHPLEVTPDPEDALRKLGLWGTQTARILFGDCSFRIVKSDADGRPIANTSERGLYRILTPAFQHSIQEWTAQQLCMNGRPYPDLALRESLANAVAHAAYFERDGELTLEMAPAHITISNLCLKDSLYFANRWFSRAHKTVNGLLMESLRIAHHVDELGRGKHLIFSEAIKSGKKAPSVILQRAGKYNRWVLRVHGGITDHRQVRLLARIRETYHDEQRAMIAYALVLWSDRPVAEIRNHIDATVSEEFADVLTSLDGPIFYYEAEDRVVLNRWAKLLLEEGRDSKQLTPAEERSLRSFLHSYCNKYEDGHITPKELRRLAHMGETASERSLSSNLLAKWATAGHVQKLSQGKYRFRQPEPERIQTLKQSLMEILAAGSGSVEGTVKSPDKAEPPPP